MSKKTPFLPSLNQKEYYSKAVAIDNETTFKDHREREALLFPSRVINNETEQDYTKVMGTEFKKEAGCEVDKFDEILANYYTTRERGVQPPKMDVMVLNKRSFSGLLQNQSTLQS